MGKFSDYINIKSTFMTNVGNTGRLKYRNKGRLNHKLKRLVYLQGVSGKRVERSKYRNGMVG